jgi:hypothetical protein
MKKNLLQSAIVLIAIAGLLALAGCDTAPEDLDTPANVTITVEQRTMTVTWDAVSDAQGYEIITTSTGCGSGNRIINTKDKTANAYTEDDGIGEDNYLKDDKSNGAVVIKDATTIEITLMPAMIMGGGSDMTKPMATAVSAKVRALGDGTRYLDSEYSAVTTKTLSSGMGGM